MRNFIAFIVLVVLAGPLAAQPAAPGPRRAVPAALDVAGLHLVLSEEAQRLVQQKADGLLRHQPSFQARVDLADAAFPIVDRVLREEGVPLDFRYLVLQESALQGDARSSHAAVGYWQLKQETATGLGLVVNEAVDERQHLTASTRAAARYLSRNNASLRNWLNALLSYNTGLTGVRPYTLPTDAEATEMAITAATSPYVLMFLAHKLAFEPACGQNPRPPLRLQEFPATPGQTLEAQAQVLHVEPATLAAHNHWLLAAAVPTDRPYSLIVPVGDVTQAAGIVANQRLQARPELLALPAVAGNAAEVRVNDLRALIALPGETTVDLAARANQKLGEFLRHNELTGFDAVVTGRPYYLESKRDEGAVEYHALRPGETIFDVAQQYGMRQKAIYAKNRMARVEELRPGRVLWLRHTRPREVAIEYRSLPEGAALERPAANAATETDALLDRANEIVAAHRQGAPADARIKVKIKVRSNGAETERVPPEESDGWGEALSTATVTAVATSAPPVASAPPAPAVSPPAPVPVPTRMPVLGYPAAPALIAASSSPLPPPAPAPAAAPLADEPDDAAPEPEPAAAQPAAASAPVTGPAPTPAPPAVPAAAAPVPRASVALPAGRPAVVAAKPFGALAAATTHRVGPGETVYSIGRLHEISPATIMALNQLVLPATLAVGQVLLLKSLEPLPTAAASATVAGPVAKPAASPATGSNPALYAPKAAVSASAASPAAQHTVVVGETLYSIARRYQVTVANLQVWNGKLDGNVKIGEVLRVQASAR